MVNMDKDYRYQRFSQIRNQLPIPPSLEKPVTFLDKYLETLPKDNIKNEKKIIQNKKISASLKQTLASKQEKIVVTPSAKYPKRNKPWNKYNESEPVAPTKRVDICKQETKEPIEGSLVIEERRGLRVNCNHCGHRFTHFSPNLYGQYFCTCSKCQGQIRLKHYKLG